MMQTSVKIWLSWKSDLLKLKLDYTTKWYIHKPESVPENETHKSFGDFDMQTNNLISIGKPDLMIGKQKER